TRIGRQRDGLDLSNISGFAQAAFGKHDGGNSAQAVTRSVLFEGRPLIKGWDLRELSEHEARRQAVPWPIRCARPMQKEPRDKLVLCGFRPSDVLYGRAVIFRSLVLVPLIPMTADAMQRTA